MFKRLKVKLTAILQCQKIKGQTERACFKVKPTIFLQVKVKVQTE